MSVIKNFNDITLDVINAYIEGGQEEHLQLDFKTLTNSSFKAEADKKNLAKSISGFANAMGGMIVWGVDCRKQDGGPDCASELRQIDNLKLGLTRLQELTSHAVSPSVDGVQHKAIQTSDDKGVLVSVVPESHSGPHMAKLGEDRYYKRSGASFLKMEHYEIQDMFGRRARPDLDLEVDENLISENVVQLRFWIRNSGRAVAKHSGCFIQVYGQLSEVVVSKLESVSHLNAGQQFFEYVNNASVIHPNGIRLHIGDIRYNSSLTKEPISLLCKIYCEDMAVKTIIKKYNVG